MVVDHRPAFFVGMVPISLNSSGKSTWMATWRYRGPPLFRTPDQDDGCIPVDVRPGDAEQLDGARAQADIIAIIGQPNSNGL